MCKSGRLFSRLEATCKSWLESPSKALGSGFKSPQVQSGGRCLRYKDVECVEGHFKNADELLGVFTAFSCFFSKRGLLVETCLCCLCAVCRPRSARLKNAVPKTASGTRKMTLSSALLDSIYSRFLFSLNCKTFYSMARYFGKRGGEDAWRYAQR